MEPMPGSEVSRSDGERCGRPRPRCSGLGGVVVLTLVVGFEWGGWVTGKTARSMAEAAGHDAVVARLAPMCVNQATTTPVGREAQGLGDHRIVGSTRLRGQAGLGHVARGATGGPRVAEQCVTSCSRDPDTAGSAVGQVLHSDNVGM